MGKFTYCVVTVFLFLLICFSFERRAYAYVDPGSSLYLFQGISSVFMGIMYYFRKRLKSLVRRPKVSDIGESGELG
jgi:hypothetical protein